MLVVLGSPQSNEPINWSSGKITGLCDIKLGISDVDEGAESGNSVFSAPLYLWRSSLSSWILKEKQKKIDSKPENFKRQKHNPRTLHF